MESHTTTYILNVAKPEDGKAKMPPITYYHGTYRSDVDHILTQLDFSPGKATDFASSQQPRPFYLTTTPASAEEYVRFRRSFQLERDTAPIVVMKFTVDETGLNIFDFGEATSGPTYQAWLTVSYILSVKISAIDT